MTDDGTWTQERLEEALAGLPYPAPPPDLADAIMASVLAAPAPAPRPAADAPHSSFFERLASLFRSPGLLLPVGAAALLLVGLSSHLLTRPSGPVPTAPVVARVDVPTLPAADFPLVVASVAGPLAVGDSLTAWPGAPDLVTVGSRTRARLASGASVRVATWGLVVQAGRVAFEVEAGDEPVEVGCPAGRVVVLGTRFTLDVAPSGATTLTVDEGRVRFEGAEGTVLEVTSFDGPAVAAPGVPPRLRASMSRLEADVPPPSPARPARVATDPTLEEPFGP